MVSRGYVWDYRSGSVVDPETGLVVGEIYEGFELVYEYDGDGDRPVRVVHALGSRITGDRVAARVFEGVMELARQYGYGSRVFAETARRVILKLRRKGLLAHGRLEARVKAVFLLVCRMLGLVCNAKVILQEPGVYTVYSGISRHFSDAVRSRSRVGEVRVLVDSALSKLGSVARNELYPFVVKALSGVDEVFISGRSSRTVAGAVLEVAKLLYVTKLYEDGVPIVEIEDRVLDMKATLAHIAELFNTTDNAIRPIAKQLLKKLGYRGVKRVSSMLSIAVR